MPSQLHGDLASPASTPPLGNDFAEEMRDLRNFIEASFVKQSLHFEEIMESLRHESLRQAPQPKRQPTAVATLARAGFRKSYSTTTLETEIMDMSADIEDETETAVIRPPKRPSVQEERFGVEEPSTHRVSGALQVPVSGTREGSKTNSDVTEDEVQNADSSASKGKTARFSDDPRPGARTPRPTSHSNSISEDTFVQSNMRKTMKSAEAAIETSIGSMKRFSQGLNRADTVEIDVSEISRWRHFCLRVVSANAFTNCIMLLILVNLVLLGVEIQVATTLGQFDVPRWFGIINTVIVCIFILEISLKFVAYGVKGLLCGKDAFWNNLDFLVIAASVLETAVEIWDLSLSATHGTSSAHLRIMRTMRLIRALRGIRVIRLLRYVSALRTLVFSIVSTTGSLMWTLVLLSLLFYSFGVILTQIVSDHCRFEAIRITEDDNALPNCKDIDVLLHRYWNDVPESVCTLFLAITGGLSWDDAFRPLRFSSLAVVLLVLYIIVTVFAVLNVVTGVFCNTAIESAQSDKDIAIMKQMRKHDAQVQALRHIFKEIDHDKSMHVTLAELKEALSAKKLSSFMESMGISTQDVSTLFMIIDTDKSGMIDLEEFVSGCMQLHGPAKSLQLAQMSHENRVTRQVIKHLANSISSIKKQMSSVLEFLEDRPVGTACAV